MKNLIYLLTGIFVLVLVEACENRQAKNYNDASKVDQDGSVFVKHSIEGGLTEIKASGLVLTKSNNQRIISFAKMMIDDHTKADSMLMEIEKDKKIEGKDSISSDHQIMISKLAALSGREFDKMYIRMMVADHDGAVKLFSNGSQNTDVKISRFAGATLPTIQMHLDSAKAILLSLK